MAPGVRVPDVPHWQDIIANKSRAQETFVPAVDRLLQQRRVPVWVTREYRSAGAQWTPDEYAQGLQRIFRLILQADQRLPEGLADSITLLPEVEYARPSTIAVTLLPTPTTRSMSV